MTAPASSKKIAYLQSAEADLRLQEESGMDPAITAEERAYWTAEAQRRSTDVEEARARGDSPHLVAGAELRLREAVERLEAMPGPARPDN